MALVTGFIVLAALRIVVRCLQFSTDYQGVFEVTVIVLFL